MPVRISWLLPERISYFRYEGDVSIDEVTEAASFGIALLESSQFPLVHTIQDSRFQLSFPSNVGQLLRSVRTSLTHPKMGWMTSVGIESDLVRFSGTLVGKVTRTRHRMFADMPETLEFLAHIDSTLPPLNDLKSLDDADLLHYISIPPRDHTN